MDLHSVGSIVSSIFIVHKDDQIKKKQLYTILFQNVQNIFFEL